MTDLKNSTWATRTRWDNDRFNPASKFNSGFGSSPSVKPADPEVTYSHLAQPAPQIPLSSLERYDRLVRRAEWKCRLLFESHRLAFRLSNDTAESYDTDNQSSPFLTQFKLDFFEFYSLLERTLVHLLGTFKIRVARIGPQADRALGTLSNARNGQSESELALPTLHLIGSAQGPGAGHRFHQNVLQALDQPGPLHDVLGRGDVREYLDYAKDLRNRWKDVGESRPRRDPLPQLDGSGEVAGKEVPTYEEMEKMIVRIFEGLKQARDLVEEQDRKEEPEGVAQSMNGGIDDDRQTAMDCDDVDVPFEYMEDEMEIE